MPPSFQNDQYFYLSKSGKESALQDIAKILDSDTASAYPFEKVWIPEHQVEGEVKRVGHRAFLRVEELFNTHFLADLEAKTGLADLELVAVRRNIVSAGKSVKLHSDSLGYVLMVDIPTGSSAFDGGEVVFRKDNGDLVETDIPAGQMIVAKCTNEHGVNRIASGKRESVAFFARPRS